MPLLQSPNRDQWENAFTINWIHNNYTGRNFFLLPTVLVKPVILLRERLFPSLKKHWIRGPGFAISLFIPYFLSDLQKFLPLDGTLPYFVLCPVETPRISRFALPFFPGGLVGRGALPPFLPPISHTWIAPKMEWLFHKIFFIFLVSDFLSELFSFDNELLANGDLEIDVF